jgi:hypothetical protein
MPMLVDLNACRMLISAYSLSKISSAMAERRPDHDHPNKTSPSGLTTTHGAQRQAAQPQSQSASNPTRLSLGDFGNTVVEASAHLRHLAEKTLLPSLNPPRTSSTPPTRPVVNQTLHACEFCRKSKTRCSGGQLCERCRTYGNQCIYSDRKRDKEKKQSMPYLIWINTLLTNMQRERARDAGL